MGRWEDGEMGRWGDGVYHTYEVDSRFPIPDSGVESGRVL